MANLRSLWRRVWSRSQREQTSRDIDKELRFHVEMRTQALIDSGMVPEEARRRAAHRLGSAEKIAEKCRDVRGLGLLEGSIQDARFGLRMLRQNPAFALVAIFTLALGIGVNTAMFSILNTVLLRPLPYEAGDRLVSVAGTRSGQGAPEPTLLSAPDFLDLKQQSRVFERMAAFGNAQFDLTGSGEPMRISGARVTADLFPMLGFQPTLGHSFLPEQEKTGADRVVLIGHGLWQRRFGADPSLVGRTILLGDVFNPARSYEVIGVMPRGFGFPDMRGGKAEFWVPFVMDTDEGKDRANRWMARVLGRLKPGVTLPQAQAELNAIAHSLEAAYPDTNKGWGPELVFLHDQMVKNAQPALLILLAAVVFVLLIACANVANLLLSRSLVRQKEMAMRAVLGASRRRVMRQLLVESMLLSLLGGLAGVVLVACGFKPILSLIPSDMPRVEEISVDGAVLCFTLAVSMLTGLLFGVAPALQLSRPSLSLSLAESSQGSVGSGRQSRLQGLLVVVEVAMAMILLVGAGLLLQSLVRLRSVPLGFNPRNVLTLGLQLPDSRYPSEPQQIAFYNDVLGRIAGLPGVASVGAARELPIGNNRLVITPIIEGRPEPKLGDKQWASPVAVSLGYLQTMGIPLIKGRGLTEQDRPGTLEVALINEAMAKRFWSNEDAIGKRFKWADMPWGWVTVVGVVRDARQVGEEIQHLPEFYRPMAQFPNGWMSIVLRTKSDPMKSAALVCGLIWTVDRDLPIQNIRTIEQILSDEVVRPRFYARLVGAFATLALILTGVGVYGVMAYGVSRRTREIGIRMALGAEPHTVLRLVLRRGMTLALTGVALGIVGAAALTRYAASLLHGVRATDPATFAAMGLLLACVALAACLGPARRATRIDPMTALRCE